MSNMFKKINSKQVYQNPWLSLIEDEIQFENESRGTYAYAERSDGVSVIILNEKTEILLVKQYRYPIQAYEWNIPGGGIDSLEPEEAARTEIEEEVGVKLGKLEKIAEFYPLSSLATEKSHIFLARVANCTLEGKDVSPSDEEIIEKRFFSIKQALNMIDQGKITDANTANMIQLVARKINS